MLYGSLTLLAAASTSQILKETFGRVRPDGADNSFPSGHATAAFAFAVVLSLRYPKQRLYFFLLAAMLAITRVLLLKHYPSDILAGAAIGMTMGLLVEPLAEKFPAVEYYRKLRIAGAVILFLSMAYFGITSNGARRMLLIFVPLIIVLCIMKLIQRRRLVQSR